MTSPSPAHDFLCQIEVKSDIAIPCLQSISKGLKEPLELELECHPDQDVMNVSMDFQEMRNWLIQSQNNITELVGELAKEPAAESDQLSPDDPNETNEIEFESDIEKEVLSLIRDLRKTNIHLSESQTHRDTAIETMLSIQLPTIPVGFENAFDKYEISTALEIAMVEHQRRIISHSSRAMIEEIPPQGAPSRSDVDQSKKRKIVGQGFEPVCRPSNLVGYTRKGRRSGQKHTSRPVIWMKSDIEDTAHPNSPRVVTLKDEINAHGLDWLSAANSGPRIQQSGFTFRCYPRGLASRTRHTKIFLKQSGETILSATQWEALNQYTKSKKVTLAYLAEERWRNFKARQKTTEEPNAFNT